MADLTQQGTRLGQQAVQSLSLDQQLLLQTLLKGANVASSVLGQSPALSPISQLPEAMIKGANKALSSLGEKFALEASQTPEGMANMTQMLSQPKITEAERQLTGTELNQGLSGQGARQGNARQTNEASMFQTQESQQLSVQPSIGTSRTQQTSPQNILQQLLGMVFTPSSVNQQGIYQPASALGGLLRTSGADQLASQQAQLTRQELLGQKPLQAGEREKAQLELEKSGRQNEFKATLESYKQDRLDQREEIKSKLEGLSDSTKFAELAKDSALGLIDLRSRIGFKGPVLGPIGAVGGALGIGSEGRAQFESATNQFVFDVGNLLGQKGRAFTEKEQKLVREKVIQASLSAKQSDFNGRMKAIFRRINQIAGDEILTDKDLNPRRIAVTKSAVQGKGIPSVGETFNGEKVLSVKRVS